MNRRNFFARVVGAAVLSRFLKPAPVVARDFELYEFHVVSTPVAAKVRKLSVQWSCAVEQELQAFHSVQAEKVIEQILAGVVEPEQQRVQYEML